MAAFVAAYLAVTLFKSPKLLAFVLVSASLSARKLSTIYIMKANKFNRRRVFPATAAGKTKGTAIDAMLSSCTYYLQLNKHGRRFRATT